MAYFEKKDEVKALRDKIKFDPEGAYLFWGEEEYLKRYYLDELRKLISEEGMEEFNKTVLDFLHGDSLKDLEEAVDSLPVMASRKIIEVWGMSLLNLKKDEEKRLVDAVKRVGDGTILVIYARATELDLKPKKNRERELIKKLSEHMTVTEFPRQTEQKLLSWVDKIFRLAEIRISDVNITRMINLCDYSMTRLKNDSDKLIAYCKFNKIASVPDEIVSLFVKPCAENEVWDFSDAVVKRSKKEALAILENLRIQRLDPIVIVSVIGKTLTAVATVKSAKSSMTDKDLNKLADLKGEWQVKRYRQNMDGWSEERLKRATELTFKCEGDLKSTTTPEYVLVESLVTAILE